MASAESGRTADGAWEVNLSQSSSSVASYRPDIDGLRAIAVLTVVGFHAEIAAFSGGFIGVDVFFVISGFLITGIIMSSVRRGTFTFAEFYTRRINRIFPALITVVLATCIVGWLVFFPPEFESLGKHAMGGAGFVSNFVLWNEAGYFESAAKPLLHLWSLAVEEQFYLVWPVVLLICWKCRWNMKVIVTTILVASFAASLWEVNHGAGNAAFYLPGTRFWEIASGALLCFTGTMGSRDDSAGNTARHAVSVLGLVLIVVGLLVIDKDTPWPGWLTLLPVVGSLMLLASGPDSIVGRWLLSRRILVGIGLISYPLYLWHWPVLVIARLINEGQLTRAGRIGMVLLSIALAAATYRFIEVPIRFGERKRRSAVRLAAGMFVVALIGCAIDYQVVRARLSGEYAQVIIPSWGDILPPGGHFNDAREAVGTVVKGDSTRIVAVVGDSHAIHYQPRFEELARINPATVPEIVLFTFGGCPPISGIDRKGTSWDGSPWTCANFHRQVMKQLAAPAIRTVMIAAYWEGYFHEFPTFFVAGDKKRIAPESPQSDSVFRLLEGDVNLLRRQGKRVFLVLSSPNSPDNNPHTMLPRRLPWLPAKKPGPPARRDLIEARTRWIDDKLRAIGVATGAIVIDPNHSLCDATACPSTQNGLPIYTDEHHLRASFVRKQAMFLDTVLSR